ncbi:MAG: hypothetical protein MR210_00825 [Erysipelotrichaceae bacterium]|nr:hypothetical protein [Erysipelotrichaceae bacterium]MDY5251545.1 hypothetical protein [Erysipelotrichaceae bacterium]
MKKIMISLMSLGLLVGCTSPKVQMSDEPMTININIIDEVNEKELFKGSIKTRYKVLADALEHKEELKVVMEDGKQGKYITSMMDVASDGKNFWTYESDNNDDCLEAAMCKGVSETTLEDGDNFVFIFTDESK